MKNKTTLTIGIPAFNEETNIAMLLSLIAQQRQVSYVLEKVIVASDGSTDKTVERARACTSVPLEILEQHARKGKGIILNHIFENSKSDVLVLLDADTYINDELFIEKLISSILNGKADLTSARVDELPPTNFFEATLFESMAVKKNIFAQIQNGNNIFTCHGRSRGLSRKLYTKLRFHNSASEDAYSYLFCVTNGFVYAYVDTTSIFYQLPKTLGDHLRQSVRYFQHDRQFAQDFPRETLAHAYRLPVALVIKHVLLGMMHAPIHLLCYTLIVMFTKVQSVQQAVALHAWNVSSSSKDLSGGTL